MFSGFVKYTQQQGLQVEVPAVGTTWQLGGATITQLGPVAQYSDTNDTSIVLRIDYGATSFLLTGDMEADAERDLVNSGANLKVDVLQVGHHGSSTSTSYVFLNAVLPEMGIISCGVNNKYGHPHEETLSILRDAKVDVYRTDLQGTITIGSDGQNLTVGTEHFVPDSQLNPTAPAASSTAQQAYIGNVNSKKFHHAHLPQPPGGEKSDPVLQLRRGRGRGLYPLQHLHPIKNRAPVQSTGRFRLGAGAFCVPVSGRVFKRQRAPLCTATKNVGGACNSSAVGVQ